MTPTLSSIAADVRRLATEQFPAGFNLEDGTDRIWFTSSRGTYPAPVEVARLALIGAMVLACKASRLAPCDDGWVVPMDEANADKDTCRYDVDHGNDPLLSLHAAFLWAKGGGK